VEQATISQSLPDWIKEHITLYLADGDAGHLWTPPRGDSKALTTLLLTTTGRKSGKQLLLPLIYRPTGDGAYCIIASKGGAPEHPAWYLNLAANPNVQVQVANDSFRAKARVAEGEERQRLWTLMSDYFPPYNDYQTATERHIPVIVLDRD